MLVIIYSAICSPLAKRFSKFSKGTRARISTLMMLLEFLIMGFCMIMDRKF